MKKDDKKLVKRYLSVNDLCHDLGFKTKLVKQIANNIDSFYYDNPQIDKKGKLRPFKCTRGQANIIQKRIHIILSQYEFPNYMFGVKKGKCITDNALIHLSAKTLVTIDIKNCFPNTTSKKVLLMLRKTLGFSKLVAELITQLVVYQDSVPQGTHSSSVVVALCLLPMCQELNKFCLSKELKVSIWADDIAISGKNAKLFIDSYIWILKKFDYSCKRKKIKIWEGKKYKEITGRAVVNNRLTIPKNKIKECNSMIIKLKKGTLDSTVMPSLKGKLESIRQVDIKQYQKLVMLAKKIKLEIK